MTSHEKDKSPGGMPPLENPVFPIWQLERQVAEQLHRGVRTTDGSVVAISVGSSMFTFVKKVGDDLIVKYVDCCIVVSASAKLVGNKLVKKEVKVYDVTVHNICSKVDL